MEQPGLDVTPEGFDWGKACRRKKRSSRNIAICWLVARVRIKFLCSRKYPLHHAGIASMAALDIGRESHLLYLCN